MELIVEGTPVELRRGELELESFLPLSDAAYVVLSALSEPRDSARGFLGTIEENVDACALAPGALIAAVDRLVQLRLVRLVVEAEGTEGERYRVTRLGDAVLWAESGRRCRCSDTPTLAWKLLSASNSEPH